MAHGAAGMRTATDLYHVGVAEDDLHLLDLHLDQGRYALREARLMALPGRLRADDDIDAAFRPYINLRLLLRRTDRGFHVVAEPEAEELAALPGFALALVE